MLSKKGFVITPIIFIAFFIIAIVFSSYVANVDREVAYSIRKSSSIEKGVHNIQKAQTNQINFARIATYKCSETNCYNSSNSSSVDAIETCVNSSLTEKFKPHNWNILISNSSGAIYLKFSTTPFSASNINMTSDSIKVNETLCKDFLNTSCS